MITSDGTVYLDNSTATNLAKCSTLALMRNVHGYSSGTGEVSAPLRQGKAGHEALATYFRALVEPAFAQPPTTPIVKAMQTYEAEYRTWAEEHVPSTDRLSWKNSSAILAEWFTTRHERLPFAVERADRVEVGFSSPLDDSGRYRSYGRLDLIATWSPTGEQLVVEHKFSGAVTRRDWAEQWSYASQITGYLWNAKQHFPAVRGVLINAIEVPRLSTSDRQCAVHKVPCRQCCLAETIEGQRGHWTARFLGPYMRTDAQLEEWRLTTLVLAKKYEELARVYGTAWEHIPLVRQQGPFTDGCKWCGFKDWCSLGRPVSQIERMLVYDPWIPFDPTAL